VGVMLARETPVRAADLARGRVTRDPQQPIVVEFAAPDHHRPPRSPTRRKAAGALDRHRNALHAALVRPGTDAVARRHWLRAPYLGRERTPLRAPKRAASLPALRSRTVIGERESGCRRVHGQGIADSARFEMGKRLV